ncbi:hypothetical protein PPYR_07224 [Photinus pyralis]|uniref:SAM domain-containing protein n=1 Tax=Photinus pyralis TaxID=7054 RepID=A0A1Y1M5C9_PHOPY|nr:stromal interaction molecule homolog isoform X1 [Photinus pyralis]XP_031340568.1 stromal interaction molecule homolog isoform X1 [Photinus pyralis]KAB0799344.1 hypothetical protein PPYR_07224 [Photinus pyralis]
MYIRKLTLWLVFIFYWCNGDSFDVESAQKVGSDGNSNPNVKENLKSTYSVLSQTISKAVLNENLPQETCSSDDLSCFGMDTQDKLGLEAIQALHHQLDDDRNGNVDLTETDDFLREELQYNSGYERRQKAFHRNDDMHISVKELWEAWLRSEVHNWTSQQTSEWLAINVELPQYVNNFLQYNINGAMLPRLAVNNMQLLNNLGIKDPIHKQKIALKAMDVVLFGPPKDHQPHWKDLTLIVLIIGGSIGMWYAVQQNKKFKSHLTRMNKDMEGLQHAESALENLQRELERAVEARENVVSEKQNLEKKLQEAGADSLGLHNSYSDLEVSQLKAEIEMLRHELQIAEGELKDRCWSPPVGLQHWLQLTHEIENKAYIKKKMVAEKQLQQAREACEKLRKKRSSLVGAFVSTHGKSIDDVDRSIVEARTSLNEVTQELQERVYRWKQVELLCGFNIISNSGLQQLENMLYRNTNLNGRPMTGLKGRMSSSQDDLDDDTCSLYTVASGYTENASQLGWREADSSGSEASKTEEELTVESKNLPRTAVQFLVGAEVSQEEPAILKHTRVSSQPPSLRSSSNNNIPSSLKSANIIRSSSQDINISSEIATCPKPASSENALDRVVKQKNFKQQMIKEQPSISLEDDIYSTDSSLIDDEMKKPKRKLFGFSRRSKPKYD